MVIRHNIIICQGNVSHYRQKDKDKEANKVNNEANELRDKSRDKQSE
jgi:hypothetical protein